MAVYTAAAIDCHGARGAELRDPDDQGVRYPGKGTRTFGTRRRFDDGGSRVTPLSHRRFHRNLAEQRRFRERGHFFAAAPPERLMPLLASVADEVALVLDHAEDGD